MDKEMMRALEADGEKLRDLTGEDHGPMFVADDLAERLRNCSWNNMDEWDAVMRAAADRIEALEKAIREWSTAGNSTEAAVAAINLRCALEAK